MYGLKYDYILQGEHYIVFSKEDDLSSDDLTNLQVKMLQFNTIPHLLPFEKDEMNCAIRLLYRYTNKRMLTHEMRSNSLSILDYYKIIYKIVTVLIDSQVHMLSEENYILHEDFIFIGKDYSDLYLCYLPLQSLENKPSAQEEVNTLALSLMTSIKEIKGHGFQEFIKSVRDSDGSLNQLKLQLYKLIDEELQQEEFEVKPLLKEKKKPDTVESVKLKKFTGLKSLTLNKKLLGYILGLLLIGSIIMLYLTYPSEGLLYIGLGLTVLIIDALYVMGKLWKSNKESVYETAGRLSVEIDQDSFSIEVPSSSYYEELPNHTSILNKSDATVYLNSSMKVEDQEPVSVKAFIQLGEEEGSKRIQVKGERFVMGRDSSAADYKIDSVGASRLHCEIMRIEDKWGMKDLGSSNGSYLNGDALVPYKWTHLQDGDRIKVVRSEFVFILG